MMRFMRGAATVRRKPTAGRPRASHLLSVSEIYHRLYAANGRQHWWPGNGAFEIMVGAVLTQNTAWTNVERAIVNLKRARALSPAAIVHAHPRHLAAWLKPSGYFNVKARRLKALCRWVIEQGGVNKIARRETAELRAALLTVHGVGPETADDILLYSFKRPVFVIDAYTRRIFARLGLISGDEPYEVLRGLFERKFGTSVSRFNEYHALIVIHGKEICKKQPLCYRCCLSQQCPSVDLRESSGD
ncbi:MAG: endonuclease [Gammaproteobacteria bacterium]|nr:endonuclease [Gammaproteobacteria bacterium]MDH3407528.1 endonuclease [Gammaproteobacteria bacterium]